MCCHTVQKTAQLPLHRTRGLDVTGKPPWACRLLFAYEILTPAALNFFVNYADGAVESLWSIDQYFEFVLVLLLSTGLSFQVRHGCLLSLYTFNATAAGTRHPGVARQLRPRYLKADVFPVEICGSRGHHCSCSVDAVHRSFHPDSVGSAIDLPLSWWRCCSQGH